MARSGYAKGKDKGHITEQRELKPRPASRKGVSWIFFAPSVRRQAALLGPLFFCDTMSLRFLFPFAPVIYLFYTFFYTTSQKTEIG
jgi:hypothetical protein